MDEISFPERFIRFQYDAYITRRYSVVYVLYGEGEGNKKPFILARF